MESYTVSICDALRDLVSFVKIFYVFFKNVKNTHGGVLLLVLKVTLFHGCFHVFKLYKWYQIAQNITYSLTYHPNEGYFGLWKIVFRTSHHQSKRWKKYSIKRKTYNVNKIWFQALYVEVTLVLLQRVIIFWEFSTSLYFFLFPTLSLFVSICKKANLAKIWGASGPPPVSTGLIKHIQAMGQKESLGKN